MSRSYRFCFVLLSLFVLNELNVNAQSVSRIDLTSTIAIDGLYAAPDGYLYGAGGYQSDTIYQITRAGSVAPLASGIDGPIHMAMDSQGQLFVSSFNDQKIYKVADEGGLQLITNTPIRYPTGMVFGPDDALYIAHAEPSYGIGGITKMLPDGSISTFAIGRGIDRPVGLAVDENGNLYAANWYDTRINKITPDGEVSLFSESLPQVFSTTIGHMTYSNGYLYATDLGHHQVVRIDMQGILEVFAGDGSAGDTDGTAPAAQFERPNGISVSPDGSTLYVASLGPRDHVRTISLSAATDTDVWQVPVSVELGQNYPNPFNPNTTIEFALDSSAPVSIRVFDMLGKEVAVLADGTFPAGAHTVRFDAARLTSGSYIYELTAGAHREQRIMSLIK